MIPEKIPEEIIRRIPAKLLETSLEEKHEKYREGFLKKISIVIALQSLKKFLVSLEESPKKSERIISGGFLDISLMWFMEESPGEFKKEFQQECLVKSQ